MRIDLHLHSHVSDGHLSPAALVNAAAAASLDVIALTDHDTAAGVAQALATAESLPITVIPGIEISTRWNEHEFHVLGYWIDVESPAIREHQAASVTRRVERMKGMVSKLRDMGLSIAFDDVIEAAGPEARSVGRPHLARALLARGCTRYYGEAFARFIADGGPAFVAQAFPSPAEAIAVIHAAGGVAVWAHPPTGLVESLLPRFVEWRLDGIECFRCNHLPLEIEQLLRLTEAHGLFPTGGSDWHGPHRREMGDFFVRESDVRQFLEVGAVV